MSILFVMIVLLSGQPVLGYLEVPAPACEAKAAEVVAHQIENPDAVSVSAQCVPQGSAA